MYHHLLQSLQKPLGTGSSLNCLTHLDFTHYLGLSLAVPVMVSPILAPILVPPPRKDGIYSLFTFTQGVFSPRVHICFSHRPSQERFPETETGQRQGRGRDRQTEVQNETPKQNALGFLLFLDSGRLQEAILQILPGY